MKDSNEQKAMRRLSMLAEIASMYYELDMTQSEIAREFCISRTRISRLLKMAKEEGVVTIQIHHAGERSYDMEEILKRKYCLKEAIVINNKTMDYENILRQMGGFAARYMEEHLISNHVVGITWGRSIAKTIEALKNNPALCLEVVQIMGGTQAENPLIEGSELVRTMIRKCQAKALYLNAPLYISDDLTRETLKKQPIIANTLNKGKKADMVVSGIGDVANDTFAYLWAGYDNHKELEELAKQGAAGFICAQAYNIYGEEIKCGFNEKVIGITLEELKKIKTVLGVSGGRRKAMSVLGALRGGYINVLITDHSCAAEIMVLEDRFKKQKKD